LEKSWKKIGKEREKPRITGQGALARLSWIDAGSRFGSVLLLGLAFFILGEILYICLILNNTT
jgi:hypothetical protein